MVPLQKAAGDELAQRLLLKARHGAGCVHRPIARRQLFGQHHETQTQTGRERPRKGVHIDDLPPAVHRAQSRRARAGKAELTVVIVLQNITARLARPAQQRFPLAGLHLLARRKLMGRGNVGRAPRRFDTVRARRWPRLKAGVGAIRAPLTTRMHRTRE